MARSNGCIVRTSECLEPGGYRSQWRKHYLLQFDIRDVKKNLALYSTWGTLKWHYMDEERGEHSTNYLLVTLECDCENESSIVGQGGCASWAPGNGKAWAMREADGTEYDGMLAATLFEDHPAMADSAHGATKVDERYTHYWKRASERGDVRLDVRVIHSPSGKAALLCSSQGPGDSHRGAKINGRWGVKEDVLMAYPHTRMHAGSPFPGMTCEVSWLHRRLSRYRNRLALDDGSAGAHPGDVEVGTKARKLKYDFGMDRVIYKMLQTFPWTGGVREEKGGTKASRRRRWGMKENKTKNGKAGGPPISISHTQICIFFSVSRTYSYPNL